METQKPAEPTKSEAQNLAPDASVPNPLAQLVSHFEDDPYWDVMMDSIRRHRREMDAEWDNVEQRVYLTVASPPLLKQTTSSSSLPTPPTSPKSASLMKIGACRKGIKLPSLPTDFSISPKF